MNYKGYDRYQFRLNYYWLTIPKIQMNDVIGIAHPEGWSLIPGSEFGKHTVAKYYSGYKDQYGGCYCKDRIGTVNEFDYNPKVGVNGVASKFKLGNNIVSQYYTAKDHKGYLTMNVKKALPMTYSNTFGSYHHQEITSSVSISILPRGVAVTPSFAFAEANIVNVQFPVE